MKCMRPTLLFLSLCTLLLGCNKPKGEVSEELASEVGESTLSPDDLFIVDFNPLEAVARVDSSLSALELKKGKEVEKPDPLVDISQGKNEGEVLLKQLLERMQAPKSSLEKVNFHFVKKNIANAYAFPEIKVDEEKAVYHIVVFSGLIESMQSDDQLAAALAHEFGHSLQQQQVFEVMFQGKQVPHTTFDQQRIIQRQCALKNALSKSSGETQTTEDTAISGGADPAKVAEINKAGGIDKRSCKYNIARLTRRLEIFADNHMIKMFAGLKNAPVYNPKSLLDWLSERSSAGHDVYSPHPAPLTRIEDIKTALKKLGVPFLPKGERTEVIQKLKRL